MRALQLFISEACISFFLGSLPLLIGAIAKKNTSIASDLSSLSPEDPVVFYLCYLLIFRLIIWVVYKCGRLCSLFTLTFFNAANKFSHQIGFTIHSIFRVIAGAIPAAVVLSIYKHGFDGWAQVTKISISTSVALLIVCCAFSKLSEITSPKPKFFSQEKNLLS